MEWIGDKRQAVARLILCGSITAILWESVIKLPALEKHRTWLEEHKLQAAAAVTALLFVLSLLLYPPKPEEQSEADCEDGFVSQL